MRFAVRRRPNAAHPPTKADDRIVNEHEPRRLRGFFSCIGITLNDAAAGPPSPMGRPQSNCAANPDHTGVRLPRPHHCAPRNARQHLPTRRLASISSRSVRSKPDRTMKPSASGATAPTVHSDIDSNFSRPMNTTTSAYCHLPLYCYAKKEKSSQICEFVYNPVT